MVVYNVDHDSDGLGGAEASTLPLLYRPGRLWTYHTRVSVHPSSVINGSYRHHFTRRRRSINFYC
jgi:hypothetical protein